MKESKDKRGTEWMESRFTITVPWLGAQCSLPCLVQCRKAGGWEEESEYHHRMPAGYCKDAKRCGTCTTLSVLYVTRALLCFPFSMQCAPVLTRAPCTHACLLRMWLCNVLSSWDDEKGKCSFSFEPFLPDPHQERSLYTSVGALGPLDYSIDGRAVLFLILK